MVGRTTTSGFELMVHGNTLKHFPITVADIKTTHNVFGPGVGSFRGKIVRCLTDMVVYDYAAMPEEI